MKKFTFLFLSLIFFSTFCFAQTRMETLYQICVKGRCGYINIQGEIVIKPQFDKSYDFHNGLARVINGGKNISDVSNHYDYILGKEGYIDKQGKYVVQPGNYHSGSDFSEGLAGVAVEGCKKEGCYGYIDSTGKVVIKPQFQTVGAFRHGTAVVRMPDNKWGIIDKTGKFVAPPIYEDIFSMNEGIGIGITLKDKKLLSADTKLGDFESVFFDQTGKIITHLPYFVSGRYNEGLIASITETGQGFIDKTGKIIIEPKFEKVYSFSEGLCPVRINKKWGYIDRVGNIIVEPRYESAFSFVEGLGKVVIDWKTGFIDKSGKIIIEPQDRYVSNFENGLAFFREGNFTGYIDKTGKYVWKSED